MLRFVVDHETLRSLRSLYGSLDEGSRPVLLRATSSMPHQLLGDDPMARLSFVRFRDLAEQAASAGKLAQFADAVAAVGKASGVVQVPAADVGDMPMPMPGPSSSAFPLREWGDALEDACAAFGVEPRVRVFVGRAGPRAEGEGSRA